jgi:hypothetical protein
MSAEWDSGSPKFFGSLASAFAGAACDVASREWDVRVQKREGEPLGLTYVAEERSLRVTGIGGALSDANVALLLRKQVRIGDHVVEVNSVRNSGELLREEILGTRASAAVHLVLQRAETPDAFALEQDIAAALQEGNVCRAIEGLRVLSVEGTPPPRLVAKLIKACEGTGMEPGVIAVLDELGLTAHELEAVLSICARPDTESTEGAAGFAGDGVAVSPEILVHIVHTAMRFGALDKVLPLISSALAPSALLTTDADPRFIAQLLQMSRPEGPMLPSRCVRCEEENKDLSAQVASQKAEIAELSAALNETKSDLRALREEKAALVAAHEEAEKVSAARIRELEAALLARDEKAARQRANEKEIEKACAAMFRAASAKKEPEKEFHGSVHPSERSTATGRSNSGYDQDDVEIPSSAGTASMDVVLTEDLSPAELMDLDDLPRRAKDTPIVPSLDLETADVLRAARRALSLSRSVPSVPVGEAVTAPRAGATICADSSSNIQPTRRVSPDPPQRPALVRRSMEDRATSFCDTSSTLSPRLYHDALTPLSTPRTPVTPASYPVTPRLVNTKKDPATPVSVALPARSKLSGPAAPGTPRAKALYPSAQVRSMVTIPEAKGNLTRLGNPESSERFAFSPRFQEPPRSAVFLKSESVDRICLTPRGLVGSVGRR